MTVHLTPAEKLLLELRGQVNPAAKIPTQLLVSGLNKMTPAELNAVSQLLYSCAGYTTGGWRHQGLSTGYRDDATQEQRAMADRIASYAEKVYVDLGYVDEIKTRAMIKKTKAGKDMLEEIGKNVVERLKEHGLFDDAQQYMTAAPNESTQEKYLMRDLVTGSMLSRFRQLLERFRLQNWGVGQLVRGIADSIRETIGQLDEPPHVHQTMWSVKLPRGTAAGHIPFA